MTALENGESEAAAHSVGLSSCPWEIASIALGALAATVLCYCIPRLLEVEPQAAPLGELIGFFGALFAAMLGGLLAIVALFRTMRGKLLAAFALALSLGQLLFVISLAMHL